MMGRQGQDVLVIPQSQQTNPQEAPLGQIEGPIHFGVDQAARFQVAVFVRNLAQVHRRKNNLARRRRRLQRPAFQSNENTAQRIVAAGEFAKARPKGAQVEAAVYPLGAAEIVNRAIRPQLLQKPEPFLGKGQRHRLIVEGPGNARVHRSLAAAAPQKSEDFVLRPDNFRAQRFAQRALARLDAQPLALGRQANVESFEPGDQIDRFYSSITSRSGCVCG